MCSTRRCCGRAASTAASPSSRPTARGARRSCASTRAESDIQQLTQIARAMVGRWGMSDAIGAVAVAPSDGRGPFLPGAVEVSPHTQEMVDAEVRRIVETAHEQVLTLLR